MNTIRKRLSFNLLLAIGAITLATGIIVYFWSKSSLENLFNTRLLSNADTLINLTEVDKSRIEFEYENEIMHNYRTNGSEFFEIYQTNEKIIAHSPSLGNLHLPFILPDSNEPIYNNLKLPDGRIIKTATIRYSPRYEDSNRKNNENLEAVLVIGSDRKQLDNSLAAIKLVVIGCGALLFIAIPILVNFIIKRELKPLQQLADQTSKINVNTLNLRITANNLPDELLPIATRLNESLARLEQSFEHERRFSSYVAHELRTPIAELRAIAELIIQYPDTQTTETDRDILNIALHLESIIQKLLTLSRAERAELQINTEEINPLQFISNICQNYEKKIKRRNLSINLKIPPDLTLVADSTLFKSIITNLIENAVDYAPERDEITIEINSENSASTFKISNTARDLTQKDIDHLFDRFWRKDTVRSPSSHIGLGLPLTLSIARILGLELSASLNSNSKIVFTLSNLKTVADELHPVS